MRTATVTVYSMGPSGSMQGIRQALSMGADAAVVVDDPALRGAEALLTARVLAAAIARNGFDVVVAGTESTDGYTGVVPQQIAELLGVPSLTFARSVEKTDGGVRIERQTAAGYDVVEAATPVVLSVTAGSVEPRYPSFKGIMAAKSKPVETLTASRPRGRGDVGTDHPRRGAGPDPPGGRGRRGRRRRPPADRRPARGTEGALMTALVFSDGTGEGMAGPTLEALTKAREWGDVEVFHVGPLDDAAPPSSAPTAPPGSITSTPTNALPTAEATAAMAEL